MRTFSVIETRHNLARILGMAQAGEMIGITRRKKLVAKIVPVDEPAPELPDFVGRARKIWTGGWEGTSSEKLLSETRDE